MALNQDIINFAFHMLNIVDETAQPSALQAQGALSLLNNILLNEAADGMRLGWYTQTNLAATAPLRDEDVYGVQYMLVAALAQIYGISLVKSKPELLAIVEAAMRQLTKRSIRYFESDLSELQRPQGGPWGGPNWI